MLVFHRRDNMRHLETRGQKGFYMGPGSGPSMDRVFLGAGGARTVKQFRHVLVPPAYAQQHAMRMHLQHQHVPPELYDRAETEAAGDEFVVDEQAADEAVPYSDEPFMEEPRMHSVHMSQQSDLTTVRLFDFPDSNARESKRTIGSSTSTRRT